MDEAVRSQRQGLLFGGVVAVMGIAAMSLMQFKMPYYILPAVPGLFLLMAVVADRFFGRAPRDEALTLTLRVGSRHWNLHIRDERRFAWAIWGLLAIASVAGVIAANIWMRKQYPAFSTQGTLMAAGVLFFILFAGIMFIRGHGWAALGILAITSVLTFHLTWYGCAAAIDTVDEVDKVAALARGLDSAGVPPDAKVLWANRRPDARLNFYHNRRSTYLITPEKSLGKWWIALTRSRRCRNCRWSSRRASAGSRTRLSHPRSAILRSMSMFISHKGHLVASAGNEFERQGKHWVAVSNASRP